ncbi:MAG: hypothetical protein HRU11_00455 [Parvularculaceae bacterium]|nr:hypothetical protein [Parvularculaceae bacterium]
MEAINAFVLSLSENYGVNPWIFGVLYIGGIPLFLGVTAWLVARLRQKKSITVQAILAGYLAIQPYVYVALVGENIPVWVWGVIAVLVGLGIWSTLSTIKKRKAEVAADATKSAPASS